MKKRIGIITYHRSYNYGSVLQAYALSRYLSKDHDVKVIDFIQTKDFKQYRLVRIYRKNTLKRLLEDFKDLNRNKRRKENFQNFVEKYIPLTKCTYKNIKKMNELNNEFDVFICGSDQIWNPACTNGPEPAFYLQFADPDKNKVSYAPSIAHIDIDDKYKENMKKYINYLDHISIREQSSEALMKELTNKKVTVAIDPTLLLDSKDYESITFSIHSTSFIFVYMLEYSEELIKYAADLSSKTGKKIYYISKEDRPEYKNGENLYGCSPEEFLGLIKDSAYVVTNSFHATVFSVLFEKQFVTFKTKLSFARMTNLLNSIGLSERIYTDDFDINKKIYYQNAKERLEKFKESSKEFLKSSLS